MMLPMGKLALMVGQLQLDPSLHSTDVEVDIAVLKAFHLSQYTAQYMLHCNEVLQKNNKSWEARLEHKRTKLKDSQEKADSKVPP